MQNRCFSWICGKIFRKKWNTSVVRASGDHSVQLLYGYLRKKLKMIPMVVGKNYLNLWGLGILKGKNWTDDQGRNCIVGVLSLDIHLFPTAPPHPSSCLTIIKLYPLPLGAHDGISPVLELKEQGTVVPILLLTPLYGQFGNQTATDQGNDSCMKCIPVCITVHWMWHICIDS